MSGLILPAEIKDRIGEDWRVRLLRIATGSGKHRTLTGLIVSAVLFEMAPSKPPRIVTPTAIINDDGRVLVGFQERDGSSDIKDIGSVEEIRDDLRQLADAARLTDDQRTELFDELKKWLAVDWRAINSADHLTI